MPLIVRGISTARGILVDLLPFAGQSIKMNCPATAPNITSRSGVHLLLNLNSVASAIMYNTAAGPLCAAFEIATSTGLAWNCLAVPCTLDLRIWKLMTVMTPIAAPQRPSKKLASILQESCQHINRLLIFPDNHIDEGAYLALDQLL